MIDVAIVGAGPYGLSVAAHALAHGLEVQVFGRPMESWDRNMPVGMLLKSEPAASNLADPGRHFTFEDYCARNSLPCGYGQPIPVDRFVDYGRWFQKNAVHDCVVPVDVTRVAKDEDEFVVTLSTEEVVRARTVVLALGFLPFAHRPAVLEGLPGELSLHSCQVHDPARFAGKDVALIGAGQSALETACLLREAGARPLVVVRTAALEWNTVPVVNRSPLARALAPMSGLGTGWKSWVWSELPGVVPSLPASVRRRIVRNTLGPAGSWWLRERFAGIPVLLSTQLREARAGDDVTLTLQGADGEVTTVRTDHVIAATGYVVDVARITVLDRQVRRAVRHLRSAPRLSRHFETSVPGLFIVGLAAAPTFGPVMRFVHGTRFAARTVTSGLVRSVRK
ncbi:NAD(P)-binding domain-containing protein [Thermoactinospora rubra]|uniref:NAD(P)-binding domain-containing protein n=1 Tax=Thermoactinospora rubra TaxID=1088767 RepID=UPI000A0F6CE8|nr:NAD(P)-binding domain-containing protein [Thermoactinospora rubra]